MNDFDGKKWAEENIEPWIKAAEWYDFHVKVKESLQPASQHILLSCMHAKAALDLIRKEYEKHEN